MAEQRYTLALPEDLYEELRRLADTHEASIKEIVRQCLKFGLVAMKFDESPDKELIVREKVRTANGDADEVRETRLRFIW